MGYNSFDTEFKRAMSSTKETLKALINKLGGTVKDEQITDFPSLVGGIEIAGDAADISYDNTTSGLTATDVQSAIDEVYGIQKEVIPDNIVLHDDSEIGEPFIADADTLEGHPASYFATSTQLEELEQKAGAVKSVAGVQPGEDGNVNLTASQIGAAPSGFGLGSDPVTVTDFDTATKNGWYRNVVTGPDVHSPDGSQWFCLVSTWSSGALRQDFYAISDIYNGGGLHAIRWFHSTAFDGWSPFEWVNPPMKIGLEYRTIERYNGKPVYRKIINTGTLPTEAGTTKYTYSDDENCRCIRVTGTIGVLSYSGGVVVSVPLYDTNGSVRIGLYGGTNTISVAQDAGYSYSIDVLCEYIKTTD